MKKVIVAGGRDFSPLDKHRTWLKEKLLEIKAKEVVSGGCTGADKFGEDIAKELNIRIKSFPANWAKYGKSAGPIRNKQMAEYANVCILFPGGRGTASMKDLSIRHGLEIIEYEEIH